MLWVAKSRSDVVLEAFKMLLPTYWSGKYVKRCELSREMGVYEYIWKEEYYV